MDGVIFAPFLFGLFLLALVGVFGGLEDRTVREHNRVLDGKTWRNGSVATSATRHANTQATAASTLVRSSGASMKRS